MRDDAAIALGEVDEPVIGVEARRAEARLDRVQQHAVQLAAMDTELRHVIARIQAAQFAPHHLPQPVGVNELAGADPGLVQRRQQSERREFLDRMRQQVDADAEFAQLLRLLEDLDLDARLTQRQRRDEAANAAADDQELHPVSLGWRRRRRRPQALYTVTD